MTVALRCIVLFALVCFAGEICAVTTNRTCGGRVAYRDDALLQALKSDPKALRDRLMRDAQRGRYELSQVPIAESVDHLDWMRRELRTLPFLDRSLQLMSGGRYHQLSDDQSHFVATFADGLRDLVAHPEQISYRDYLRVAGLYTMARDMTLNPGSTPLGESSQPLELWRFPLRWSGVDLDSLNQPGARGLLVSRDRKEIVPELSEYVVLPLRQDFIDDELFEEDEFLLLLAYRIFPAGLLVNPLHVHAQKNRPGSFLEHDIGHSQVVYEAWKNLVERARDVSLPENLRRWYEETADDTEGVAERLVAATRQITDTDLRRSVRAISWQIFHETEVSFNALDAYNLLHFSAKGRLNRFSYKLVSQDGFRSEHGYRALYWPAIRWHMAYWESQLPSNKSDREALLAVSEQDLIQRKLVVSPGAILYPRASKR